jgi:hypothetical protein
LQSLEAGASMRGCESEPCSRAATTSAAAVGNSGGSSRQQQQVQAAKRQLQRLPEPSRRLPAARTGLYSVMVPLMSMP